ncbi:hypothetical protein [Streptosporangium roseum]|uniref:hypothetical protein n=1 Tax=Streptosporangium roseum TaxID=2001 RepID=UPI0003224C16|nr:hypothetical protein [Streptosporangium roseum]
MNNRISQSVPHLHIRVVPRHHKDGLCGFSWSRTMYGGPAETEPYALRINEALPPGR